MSMYDFVSEPIHLTWNSQFREASAALEDTKATIPRCALHNVEVQMLAALATGEVKAHDKVLDQFDHVEDMAEACMKSKEKLSTMIRRIHALKNNGEQLSTPIDPKDMAQWAIDCKLVCADAALFKGLLHFLSSNWLRGAYNIRKSWKLYLSLLETIGIQPEKSRRESSSSTDLSTEDSSSSIASNDSAPDLTAINDGIHQNLVDAIKFGASLFYVFLSLVPTSVMKVLSVMGFVANRDAGFRNLSEVFANNSIRGPFAALVIIGVSVLLPAALETGEKATNRLKPYVDSIIETFPRGMLFRFLCSHYEMQRGNVSAAIELLNQAIAVAVELNLEPNQFYYALGNCYLTKLDYPTAIERLEILIAPDRDYEAKAYVCYELAGCYQHLNNTAKAKELLKKASSFAKKKDDEIIADRCSRILKSNYQVVRSMLIPFEALQSRRDFDYYDPDQLRSVVSQLDSIFESAVQQQQQEKQTKSSGFSFFSSSSNNLANLQLATGHTLNDAEVLCTFLMLKGSVLRALGEYESARTYLRDVIKMEKQIKDEKQSVAIAHFELGVSYYKQDNLQEALSLFKAGYKYEDYDYDNLWRGRFYESIQHIERELRK